MNLKQRFNLNVIKECNLCLLFMWMVLACCAWFRIKLYILNVMDFTATFTKRATLFIRIYLTLLQMRWSHSTETQQFCCKSVKMTILLEPVVNRQLLVLTGCNRQNRHLTAVMPANRSFSDYKCAYWLHSSSATMNDRVY